MLIHVRCKKEVELQTFTDIYGRGASVTMQHYWCPRCHIEVAPYNVEPPEEDDGA